ncbi:uncharacterized protein LOC126978955 [Leptidea sinapis]|uniref:uncharacterized protein LOC126978955 n=1 Tax=Leptidea sinapis TaxID=189913 RepID=UPI0021C322BF|nr:uncharacterized protein LOC126978955 [Leptidea sinapis]
MEALRMPDLITLMKNVANVTTKEAKAEKHYSGVTLNSEWSRGGRLLFILGCAGFGTFMNIFFVAAFFVSEALWKRENIFLAFVGLSELIVPAVVLPIVSLVLVSGEWDNIYVCKAIQTLCVWSTYSSYVLFMFASLENFMKVFFPKSSYDAFCQRKIVIPITLGVIVGSLVLAVLGTVYELDYDYCEHSYSGNSVSVQKLKDIFQRSGEQPWRYDIALSDSPLQSERLRDLTLERD